jgi:GNAT superfamily N-acetyltransferase
VGRVRPEEAGLARQDGGNGGGAPPGRQRCTCALRLTSAAFTRSFAQEIVLDAPIVRFRRATREDVPALVRLLADDPLGAQREAVTSPLPGSYYAAFEAIERDPNNELIVAETADGQLAGMLQLTFIPYLTYRGGWRALVEGVRVVAQMRSRGVGRRLFEWAIERARERGCHMIQLTSDKSRAEAIRFYESLGFVASHEGMKLHLG